MMLAGASAGLLNSKPRLSQSAPGSITSAVVWLPQRAQCVPNSSCRTAVVCSASSSPSPSWDATRELVYPAGEKKPQVEKAILHLQGLRANNVTVAYKSLSDLMTACWVANNVEDAEVIFEDMKNAKYKIHPKVWVKYMQLHARRGRFMVVEDLIQQMREAGVEVKGGMYDSLLLSYCRAGKPDQALSVFREYKLNLKPSLVAYNMLIDICGKAGRHEEAMQLYVDIMESGQHPSTVTYTSLISAVVQGGRFEKAEELYQRMLDDSINANTHTFATMIHMYAKRGWTKLGHEVCLTALDSKTCKINSVVYGAMLNLYVKGRWYTHAANILAEMETKDIEPDVAGYGTLVRACGEEDDEAFAPLATAMDHSKFEPCRIAFRLARVLPGSIDSKSADATTTTTSSGECEVTSSVVGTSGDPAVEEAFIFFEHYGSTRDRDANVSFYNALLDALWRRRLHQRAKIVMLTARTLLEKYARAQYNEEFWRLDLRSLSKGAAAVALLHWLVEVSERAAECLVVAPRLEIVVGGNVVTNTGERRAFLGRGKGVGIVKQAVEELVESLGVPFAMDTRDSSPGKLHAQTDRVIRWVSMHKERLRLDDLPPL